MTPPQFQTATLDSLKNYWRIKAANALYRSTLRMTQSCLDYSGVPAVGLAANQFASESVAVALSALNTFILTRLPRDLLLALIAQFESRLVARVRSLGERENGTLGQLQARIEKRITLPRLLIEDLNEVRTRRNAIIHHGDTAVAEYVAAAAAVLPRAAPFVKVTVAGDNVSPTENYLAYAADVLVRYSHAIG